MRQNASVTSTPTTPATGLGWPPDVSRETPPDDVSRETAQEVQTGLGWPE